MIADFVAAVLVGFCFVVLLAFVVGWVVMAARMLKRCDYTPLYFAAFVVFLWAVGRVWLGL